MRKETAITIASVPTPKLRKGGFSSQVSIVAIILLLIGTSFHANAQEVIINNTTLLIAEGKYNDAEKYLDSIIRVEPKNVTALMMRGNVLLNYSIMQTLSLHIITLQDESIFSKDVATLKNNVVVIPKATALKVEQLWKKCLTIDSTRLDLQKGLCSLYGMALMRTELLNYLPVIAKSAKDKGGDFSLTLIEYAHLLQERGDKEGGYMVYKKVAGMYPEVFGIWCQLAGAYFADNDLVHTREAVEKGMAPAVPDMFLCHEAVEMYSAISAPDKVLHMYKKEHKDTVFSDYCFYLAIDKYAKHDTSWRKELNIYMSQFYKTPDSNVVYDAAKYMLSKNFTQDYNGLMGLLNYSLNDFSTKLLLQRAIKDYKDSIPPYFIAVQVLINDKDYVKANELLDVLAKKMPGDNSLLYYHAYSLYCAGDYKTALTKWTQYTEAAKKVTSAKVSLDTYLAAPYYFAGQCCLKSGNKPKAIEYFKLIVAGKDDSKYAYLAKVQLDNLGVK